MQVQERRIFEWPDPERADKRFRTLHTIYLLFGIISSGVLIYIWLKTDSATFPSVFYAGIVYLIGTIFLRIVMPPLHRWINLIRYREGQVLSCLDNWAIWYNIFNWIWYLYGLGVFIIVIIVLAKSYDTHVWFWVLIICTFVIDIVLGCTIICCISCLEARPPQHHRRVVRHYQPILDIKVENPNISKHKFYDTCVVCLENFKADDDVKELKCKHIFHPICIDMWLKNNNNCPMCKTAV